MNRFLSAGALLVLSTPFSFAADKAPIRFLALGDSYTIGEHVDPSERWPVQTAQLLRDAHFSVDDPVIIARTGWTTAELQRGIAQNAPSGLFDVVALLIGVNNQYRRMDKESYRREFIELLKQAIQFAGDKPNYVIVLSIPDWSVTPFAEGQNRKEISQQIDAFNAINREETAALHSHYVDITPISRTAKKNPDLIAEDGLHPSGRMYAQWAARVSPIIQKELYDHSQ